MCVIIIFLYLRLQIHKFFMGKEITNCAYLSEMGYGMNDWNATILASGCNFC